MSAVGSLPPLTSQVLTAVRSQAKGQLEHLWPTVYPTVKFSYFEVPGTPLRPPPQKKTPLNSVILNYTVFFQYKLAHYVFG